MIIVFDLMDTLLSDPYLAAHEKASGMTFAEFETLRPPGTYHRLERGEISEDVYWDALRAAGIPFDHALFHRTRREGYRWLPGMEELVGECGAVHRTVIGSNYPDWIEEIGREHLARLDLEIFASYQLGARKPAEQFFRWICDATGAQPDELVLIDDKSENTDAVNRFGGIGITHVSAERTRQQLCETGVLPSPR